jgi:hypothetical protein
LRVDLVIFGFAAMDGLHVESMTEDKRLKCCSKILSRFSRA